jgi:hypothetical protein
LRGQSESTLAPLLLLEGNLILVCRDGEIKDGRTSKPDLATRLGESVNCGLAHHVSTPLRMLAQTVAYAVVSIVVASCVVHYFFVFFSDPAELSKFLHYPNLNMPKRKYIYIYVVGFGVGFCLYKGILAAFWWLPRSWAETLSFVIAFFASWWVMVRTEEIALKELRREYAERPEAPKRPRAFLKFLADRFKDWLPKS